MTAEFRLEPGQNVWRVEAAERFAFIIDAEDYFAQMRKAMLAAETSIILIGWDFDPRITFGAAEGEGPPADGGPAGLGDFMLWLADRKPALKIRLLRWDTGALRAMFRGTSLFTILRWRLHPRITLSFDADHPFASSHHHKIVVIDDSLAFCGGIDVTSGRWDTRDHKDGDARRRHPSGKPYGPWHDATSAFDGAAAEALGELARRRWRIATGEELAPAPPNPALWPEGLSPTFTQMSLGIARSSPRMGEGAPIREIETAYCDMIRTARRVIYAESQYFASRRIARAIAERLLEEDPPEIVIINPQTANGWLEQLAMDTSRAKLVEALQRHDHAGRFRIYYPVTAAGVPIYVHAKLMLVDDRVLRVGSSNFNNRSMRFDTECDVILSGDEAGSEHLRDELEGLRDDLLAEHLGVERSEVARLYAETGSLIATIEALRGAGRTLEPYVLPELSATQAWLAENEILDPNGPEETFESLSKRGLFKGWRKLRHRLRRRRKQ